MKYKWFYIPLRIRCGFLKLPDKCSLCLFSQGSQTGQQTGSLCPCLGGMQQTSQGRQNNTCASVQANLTGMNFCSLILFLGIQSRIWVYFTQVFPQLCSVRFFARGPLFSHGKLFSLLRSNAATYLNIPLSPARSKGIVSYTRIILNIVY